MLILEIFDLRDTFSKKSLIFMEILNSSEVLISTLKKS